MRYIGCDRCGGYYKLEEGESLDDFERCQCGGNLSYVDPSKEIENKHKNRIRCQICGHVQEKRNVVCSKCGNILRRKINSHRGYDYNHVLKQTNEKGFLDRIEWWGVTSGIIFLIVTQIISSILLFGGLVHLATQNTSRSAAFGFFSGSLLVTVTIMIASGFIAVATIKTRDYITGMINGGLVGVFIGILVGMFALIFIALIAGILGKGDAGTIGGLAVVIIDVIIYGALTAFGGLIAIYVRRHTSII